jgi:hypothetical protein
MLKLRALLLRQHDRISLAARHAQPIHHRQHNSFHADQTELAAGSTKVASTLVPSPQPPTAATLASITAATVPQWHA